MTRFQVVIPMAGYGDRFRKAGYAAPKPLLDVAGQPLIARLLRKFPRDWRFVFIAAEPHLQTPGLREVLLREAPGAEIVSIPAHKQGPVHTVLAGAGAIDDTLPTLVNYCDFSFVWDPDHFADWTARGGYEGGIFCYKGFHPHYLRQQPYAYCREQGGRIEEVREKGHFTDDRTKEYASSGTYYFSSGALVKRYFQRAVNEHLQVNGEGYVSLVYNPMIRDGLRVQIYEIPFFLQWGTPEDLEDYSYWHRAFDRYATHHSTGPNPMRLLMPMAGRGSRFAGSPWPKPLVPVLGTPMFQTARRYLPATSDPAVLVSLTEHETAVRQADPKAQSVFIPTTTPGQADTTALGLEKLKADEAVLVSACDHGFLWNATNWERLLAQRPDVIVIGQRGYPGARRTPAAFSYLETDEQGRLIKVSVKKPLTDQPHRELVLIGTFYFASAALLSKLIKRLLQEDRRTQGERHLDSVLSVALEEGLDVRCFESDAYLNWGTPEALEEFRYWHRYFIGAEA